MMEKLYPRAFDMALYISIQYSLFQLLAEKIGSIRVSQQYLYQNNNGFCIFVDRSRTYPRFIHGAVCHKYTDGAVDKGWVSPAMKGA
jgi:hypothetical protein